MLVRKEIVRNAMFKYYINLHKEVLKELKALDKFDKKPMPEFHERSRMRTYETSRQSKVSSIAKKMNEILHLQPFYKDNGFVDPLFKEIETYNFRGSATFSNCWGGAKAEENKYDFIRID